MFDNIPPEEMPLLIALLITYVVAFAWCIDTVRYHWSSFEELPDAEQERLLVEASQKISYIGGKAVTPDPQVFDYYTKLPRKRS